jgi:flagellar hook-length control protein FliK
MMNLENNLMSLLGAMVSPAGATSVNGLISPEGVALPNENFGNLLDLVSDIQLAESQDVSRKVDLTAEFSELSSPEQEKIEVDVNEGELARFALETQSLLSAPNLSVGQPIVTVAQFNEPRVALAETSSVSEVLLNGQELQAVSGLDRAQKVMAKNSKVDVEAVAHWGAALATGDLKAVHLENPPELKIAATELSEVRVLATPSKSGTNTPIANLDEAPLSGSDFLLENSISSNSLSGAATIPATALALRMEQGSIKSRATLGEQIDTRISPENLDFVAEKIENLKVQGGGNLRIDLAPKELGAIEIRVGIKNGVLSVELKAEQASTQSSLDASKPELMGKLEKLGPSQVQVTSLWIASDKAPDQKMAKNSSSESFLISRNMKDSSAQSSPMTLQAQNVQTNPVGFDRGGFTSTQFVSDRGSLGVDASRSGAATPQSDNAWGRDERREQARSQWEESFLGKKKSA